MVNIDTLTLLGYKLEPCEQDITFTCVSQGLSGFISTKYNSRDDRVDYRLEVVQGSPLSNKEDVLDSFGETMYLVENRNDIAVIDASDLQSSKNIKVNFSKYHLSGGTLDTHKLFYDFTGDYKVAEDFNTTLALLDEKGISVPPHEVEDLITYCLEVEEKCKDKSKALIINPAIRCDYWVSVYLAVRKVDTLILDYAGKLKKEKCLLGIFTGEKYVHPTIFLTKTQSSSPSSSSPSSPTAKDTMVISSVAYKAEDTVLSELGDKSHHAETQNRKPVFMRITETELDLLGTTYYNKRDYLGLKPSSSHCILPVLNVVLSGDVCDSPRKSKKYFCQLMQKADIVGYGYFPGEFSTTALRDSQSLGFSVPTNNLYTSLENKDLNSFEKEVVGLNPQFAPYAYILYNTLRHYTEESLKLFLDAIYVVSPTLPVDVFQLAETISDNKPTPLFVAYLYEPVNTLTSIYRAAYLLLLNILGFDTLVIDPKDTFITLDLLDSCSNRFKHTPLPNSFKCKYGKTSILGF